MRRPNIFARISCRVKWSVSVWPRERGKGKGGEEKGRAKGARAVDTSTRARHAWLVKEAPTTRRLTSIYTSMDFHGSS